MAAKVAGELPASMDMLSKWKDSLGQVDRPKYGFVHTNMNSTNETNLAEHVSFKDRLGREVSGTVVVVEFRRLIQSDDTVNVVPGISNKELLHAAIGLYDISLDEMTPDTLYATVCERWARTVLLLQSAEDTVRDLTKRARKETNCSEEEEKSDMPKTTAEIYQEKDVYTAEEAQPNTFEPVYSDTEDEDSDEDEETSEDFSRGIHSFIKAAVHRREERKSKKKITQEQIGIENRLIGAATFKKAYIKPNERVMHLTLVAVRKRYQKCGIGKYLVAQVKDPRVVGQFDAVVVHADNSAIPFFLRYGFSDDTILNSRFCELAEQFTNCTLMCYLPPFSGQNVLSSVVPELDIVAMDKEVKKWREKSVDAYRAEVTCMDRLRNEIIYLKALTNSQQEIISNLTSENGRLRIEKFRIEKEFAHCRLAAGPTDLDDNYNEEEDEFSTAELIRELERHVSASKETRAKLTSCRGALSAKSIETYDHAKDSEEFYNLTRDFQEGMKKDETVVNTYDVKMINKAVLAEEIVKNFETKKDELHDPSLLERLYFCGSLENTHRIGELLKTGFSEEDFSHGEYGRGLYFSRFPSKATQFSAFGKLVLALVAVGRSQPVTEENRTTCSAPREYDSIETRGRLFSPENDELDNALCQEYVIFDVKQAQPLYLLEYAVCS